MRHVVSALLLATCVWSQTIALLTDEEIVALEARVAAEPLNRELQTLLGQNYAFTLLGITALSPTGPSRVTGFDAARAAGDFAVRARAALLETPFAPVAGEGGLALWNYSTEVHSFRIVQLRERAAMDNSAKELGIASLDRAVVLEPDNARWRARRIPITVSRSNLPTVMPLKPAEAYAIVTEDLARLEGLDRHYALANVAKLAVRASATEDAERLAQEMLASASGRPDDWNHGNAIFYGNMVLGQVALRRGERFAAAWYLVQSGRTPGSPQLNSFGPNMSLAKELVEAGETAPVLEFFELCRSFWKLDRGQLSKWSRLVSEGRVPAFGANLLY